MGDYSWIGITFYEIPDKDREAVFTFMEEHIYNFRDDEIILGEQYTADEHSLGFCSEEVAALVAEHPGLVVEAHQAGRYEFNGEVLMHIPELGTFLADEDGQGEVIVTDNVIDTVYENLPHRSEVPTLASEFKEALDRAAGAPWLSHFGELQLRFKAMGDSQPTVTRPSEDDEPEPEESYIQKDRVLRMIAGLMSDDGENAEYDRACVEIAREVLGLDWEDDTKVALEARLRSLR